MVKNKHVGIVGAGASGCICAYYLLQSGCEVTIFEKGMPLGTLIPTGGGRCNLAHAEYDFRELAKNYPRGEKFLYSVFSKFSTEDTITLFENLGVKTYTQEDGRIFPTSNSSKDVREKILSSIANAEIVREKVISAAHVNDGYKIKTNKAEYYFRYLVIATGGGTVLEGIKHNIIPFKPSLTGLRTNIKTLSGVVLKNVYSKDIKATGDILFTHFGISGPLVYKISSVNARKDFPYQLQFNLYDGEFDFQGKLNNNPHKMLKNILSEIFPQRFAEYTSGDLSETEGCRITGRQRDNISDKIHNFYLDISGTNKGEETVTSGGYDLKEINPKTLESKNNPKLYIIGEALDIDGFCGGFNLQNAWSTAYQASEAINNA